MRAEPANGSRDESLVGFGAMPQGLKNINICNFQGSFEPIFFDSVFHRLLDTTFFLIPGSSQRYGPFSPALSSYNKRHTAEEGSQWVPLSQNGPGQIPQPVTFSGLLVRRRRNLLPGLTRIWAPTQYSRKIWAQSKTCILASTVSHALLLKRIGLQLVDQADSRPSWRIYRMTPRPSSSTSPCCLEWLPQFAPREPKVSPVSTRNATLHKILSPSPISPFTKATLVLAHRCH